MTRATLAARALALACTATLLGSPSLLPSVPAQSGCPAPDVPISVGVKLQGELSTTDCPGTIRTSSYADDYVFQATAGVEYTIQMWSSDFDTYLNLRDASGTLVAYNDDSGFSLNSRIEYTPGVSGTLVVEAASYGGSGTTGAYEVMVHDLPCTTAGTIEPGQTVTGAITETDCFPAYYGGYYDRHTLAVAPGQRYVVTMTDEFLGSLALVDDEGVYVAFGLRDDEGVTTLIHQTSSAGTYAVEVSGQPDGAPGAYTLSVAAGPCTSTNAPIAPGDTVAGDLSPNDCYSTVWGFEGYTFMDRYTFAAEAGQAYVIAMASDEVMPFVTLFNSAGEIVAQRYSYDTTPAQIRYTAPAAGTYTIEATSASYQQIGDYTVSLALGVPCSNAATPIESGQSLSGALEVTDCYDPFRQSSYHDRYTFTAEAGTQYVVEMTSSTLDSYINVVDASGALVAANDDGGIGVNSRLVFTPPEPGVYTIHATSFYYEETGSYTVSLNAGAACTAAVTPIGAGETASGALTSSDCFGPLRPFSYYDQYTFEGVEGTAYTIDMAGAFDTFLYLVDATGGLVAFDDDGGPGLDARISVVLPASGAYTIHATSWAGGVTGPYTVSLAEGGGGGGEPCADKATPIALDQMIEADLDGNECPSVSRPWALRDPYTFEAQEGTTYAIAMTSDEVDTYVVLLDASGQVVGEDDDGGVGLNSRLVFEAPADGVYTIEATTFAPDETGAYTLSLALDDGGGGGESCAPTPVPIGVGQTIEAELSFDDCYGNVRTFARHDRYTAAAQPGVAYRVTMGSAEIDSWLILLDESGEVIAQDDDSGGLFDAEIVFTLQEGGVVQIQATSFGADEVGPYGITFETVDPAARRGSCVASPMKIEPGSKLENSLQKTDCLAPERPSSFGDRYTIDAVAGGLYTVTMSSDEIDSRLVVLDPSGSIVAENDNGGGKRDARVALAPTADGAYTIVAVSTEEQQTGRYEIVVEGTSAGTVGVYVPASGAWFLKNANEAGAADLVFSYGPAASPFVALSGDWDGDGRDTVGLYDPSSGFFFLRNANAPGGADLVFGFGPGGFTFVPVVGDWNGDGTDTVGVYDTSTGFFFLRNTNGPGGADLVFSFGPGGSSFAPLVGDWNGDGVDTVGVYAAATGAFFLRNANAPGGADLVYAFGPGGSGFEPLVGDWNADRVDTVGLYAPQTGTFFLRNQHAGGAADRVFGYGPAGARPVVGDWNGR
jgi:hypothetical protein